MQCTNNNVHLSLVRIDLRNKNIDKLDNEVVKKHAENLELLEFLDFSKNKVEFLKEGSFDNLKKLTYLSFSENLLEKLPSKIFHQLNKLQFLDMSHNNIFCLNQNLFENLTELKQLKIYKNNLIHLDVNIFKSVALTLEHLDISHNKLDKLESHIFNSLTNLKHLKIHMNKIVELDRDLFKNLVKLEQLDFSNNKVLTLDESLFENLKQLKILKLHHNMISKLRSNIFRNLAQLENLNLSNNNIDVISENLFESLVNLKHLDLNSNKDITHLQPKTFSFLKRLVYLNLSSNKISGLNKNLFNECTELKCLLLNNNQINSLKSSLFSRLQYLENLDVSSNLISSLNEDLFENVINLNRLEFSNNQIDDIKVGLFKNLGKLDRLVFFKNRIKSLNSKTFQSLVNLSFLNLNSNEITKLESDLFKNLKKLKILVLSNNMIENLDSDNLFDDLLELTCLDLSNNLLSEIQSEKTFKSLKKLKTLVLSNNMLHHLNICLFQPLVNLTLLNLSSNNLIMNAFKHFGRLSNLNSLILFNNKIEKLDLKSLVRNLQMLEYLDLSSNLIRELRHENENYSAHISLKELFLNENKVNFIQDNFFDKNFPNLKTLELSCNELDHWDFKFLASKSIKLSLYGNKLNVEDLFNDSNRSNHYPNYSITMKGFLESYSNPNFVTWNHIPMFSIVTGVNGIGKTTLLKSIQKHLEQKSMESEESLEESSLPLFLKVHDRIVCHDENNFVKYYANKIDKYKFYHVDTHAFIKLRQNGTSILSLASIEACLTFLKSDIVNDKINDHLNKKFKHGLKWIKEKNSFCLFNTKSSIQVDLEINSLSPGEQLILLFLLWQYIYKKFKVNGRTVLLFDEPDAHLHPALVKSFLKILTELVELGVQVIMTTHNPTTVSLAVNENLFHLECGQNGMELMIKRVEHKNEAINLLTENFVYISDPFKIVFTEGDGKNGNDNLFFNHLKNVYFQHNQKGASFIFRSIGSSQFRHFFNKDIIKKEGAFEQVDQIFLGIVDGDMNIIHSYEYFLEVARISKFVGDFEIKKLEYKLKKIKEDLNKFNRNLLRLDRYAIENYIYDPINIFFSLKNGPKQDFLVFPSKFDEYMKIDSLYSFLDRNELQLKEKEDLLNEILATTANRLIDFFKQEYLQKEPPSELGKHENSFISRFGFKSGNLGKVLDICRSLPTYDKVKLVFTMNNNNNNKQNVINLRYNPLLIFLQGHFIESIFNLKINFLQDANRKSITWHEKLISDKNTGFLVPNDLYEIIDYLVKD